MIENEWNEKIIESSSEQIRIGILPEYGAALNRFEVKVDDRWINIIDGYVSKEEAKRHRFKAVLLAPFPNRIKDGGYEFEQKIFDLPKNDKFGHAMHGFIYNQPFDVTSSKDEINLSYSYNGFEKGFPFPFDLKVKYRVSDLGLEQSVEVINNGEKSMPFGLGWHPYFSSLDHSVNNLSLKMPNVRMMEVDPGKIPTGNLLDYSVFQEAEEIGAEELDNCFVVQNHNDPIVELFYPQLNKTLQLYFGKDDEQNKYVQIYTPKDRNSIAIEPMTCAPNAFNNGLGLRILEPKQTFAWSCLWQMK